MSNKQKRKLEKEAKRQAEQEASDSKKVLMRFSEDKFYNDLDNPVFEKGKIYEISGADKILRWTKRGGEIIEAKDLKKGEETLQPNQPDPVEPVTSDPEETENSDEGEDLSDEEDEGNESGDNGDEE